MHMCVFVYIYIYPLHLSWRTYIDFILHQNSSSSFLFVPIIFYKLRFSFFSKLEIEIQVISRETIKPSSSTPKSLQKYHLSFLDQFAPPIFMPLVYFYPMNIKLTNSEKSNQLKKSLPEVLSRFYPLAGRLVGDAYVDCNDEGAPFLEAVANCNLSQVITNPVLKNMDKFFPYKLDDVQNLCMAVQTTYFQCGGLAVGIAVSHKIADALSLILFVNTWAAVARGGVVVGMPRPKFEAAAIFPPRDVAGFRADTGIVREGLAAKILTFPAPKIAALREMYSGAAAAAGSPPRRPSRVEALSAFIWSRFISATQTKPDPNKIHTVLHTVNLRTRVEPPLSEHHFGNITKFAIAMPAVEDGRVVDGGYELIQKVREAIKVVDGDFVARLNDGDELLNSMRERMAQAKKGELVTLNFTSLCRFPLYEADFGSGKPVWIGTAPFAFKSLVIFMDTTSGDGVEAWINLKKEDMEKFEADLELQEFLSQGL